MKRLRHITVLVLIAVVFAACARSEQLTVGDSAGAPAAEAPMEAESAADTFANTGSEPRQDVQDQLIIRTGNLEIVVLSTEETIDTITSRVNATGGWVVSSNVFQRGEAKSGEITVRVPVEQFDSMMNEIEQMATEVRTSSTNGEDVTEEYVDRRARLANLEATADRVRSFLEDARDVEDALAVNAELSRLEGEIEAVRGRIQYLEQSAAFSTINVRIIPDALAQPIEIGTWRATGVVRDALSALVTALQGVATLGIWLLIVALPLLLIVSAPLALIAYVIRRRRRASSPAPDADSDATPSSQ